jgi:hypothetical protein
MAPVSANVARLPLGRHGHVTQALNLTGRKMRQCCGATKKRFSSLIQ